MNEKTQNFIVEQIQNMFSQFSNNRVTTETVDTPMNQVNKQVDAHISEYPRFRILEAYPELIEAIPSLEDDFYRSPFSEQEKRLILYSCPKNSAMKYTPPDDAMLVNLQAKVANMARPVDFMIHKCIQDGVTQIPVIRLMVSDLASHMTQLRIERVQMHANNNKRTPQIGKDSVDMLLDQETYNIIFKQKIKPRGKPYRGFKPKLSQWNFEHNKITTLNNSNKA
ncbi:hypothetical protein BB561_006756, partial [Smittium simulii]